jgi:hypothetical protein
MAAKQPEHSGEAGHFCYHCGESVNPGAPTCVACGKTLDWSHEPTGTDFPQGSEERFGEDQPIRSWADIGARIGLKTSWACAG